MTRVSISALAVVTAGPGDRIQRACERACAIKEDMPGMRVVVSFNDTSAEVAWADSPEALFHRWSVERSRENRRCALTVLKEGER